MLHLVHVYVADGVFHAARVLTECCMYAATGHLSLVYKEGKHDTDVSVARRVRSGLDFRVKGLSFCYM